MEIRRRQLIIAGSALGFAILATGALVAGKLIAGGSHPTEKRLRVRVKRVVNGHYVNVDKNDRLVYAGIRAPYENEPFYDEARQRNAELVEGKELRLRFERDMFRDRKGRLFVYAFINGLFVNETLVREGLAYVRLKPDTQRFAQELLRAQAEARRKKRGIWSVVSKSDEQSYVADPKYGDFHRPTCEVVPGSTRSGASSSRARRKPSTWASHPATSAYPRQAPAKEMSGPSRLPPPQRGHARRPVTQSTTRLPSGKTESIQARLAKRPIQPLTAKPSVPQTPNSSVPVNNAG